VIRSWRACGKTIRAIEFSRDRALVAVASDGVNEIGIFSDSGKKLRVLRLKKRDRVARMVFDEFAMHLAVQIEGKTFYLFHLPILDEIGRAHV
jgi:hypothetical protein